MKSKRKIEMFDEKSKRACLPSVEDESATLAVGFDMPGDHSDDETDDGQYQDLSIWGESQEDGFDQLYVCSEEEDTEEEKRVGGGRRVRHSEHRDPRGSHRDEPGGLGEGARGLIHGGMHDLSDDEPVEDGVRWVGHNTSTGGMHRRGHGSRGLSSELSIGREEEGYQHSEGRACGLDDGVCGLGGDLDTRAASSATATTTARVGSTTTKATACTAGRATPSLASASSACPWTQATRTELAISAVCVGAEAMVVACLETELAAVVTWAMASACAMSWPSSAHPWTQARQTRTSVWLQNLELLIAARKKLPIP